ncbi:MAG: PEP-CTERM sorting domain-containing protein [Planctomycetota bacterium]
MKIAIKTTVFTGLSALLVAGQLHAQQTVTELLDTAPPTGGDWYVSLLAGGGTASIVDVDGEIGNLGTAQPLPGGVVQLTTGFDNADRAEIAFDGDFGAASSLLTSMTLGYDYYKQNVVGGNAAAAPTIKITLQTSGGTGDNFGQLIFEPNWNQPGGGSQNPPTDAWQSVLIDANTGGGDDPSTGGWWWTGGFEIGSSGGGTPIKSLSEWAADFEAADPVDFSNARVTSVSIGVGTFNQGQIGYFDNVSIQNTLLDATYDFQIPEPTSLALLTIGGLTMLRRRR